MAAHGRDRDALLADAQERLGEALQLQDQGGWQRNPVAVGSQHVVYLAPDAPARARLRGEERRLRWAHDAGVPVPEVVELGADDRWLVVRRVPDDQTQGLGYARAAVSAAAALRGAGALPVVDETPRSRARGRSDLLLRGARAVVSPLRISEFRALRSAAAELAARVPMHGDFLVGNVLSDQGRRVHVIDFEFLGLGHPATDLATLWGYLDAEVDRSLVLDAALDVAPRAEVLLLVHWIAVRRLSELTTSRSRRDRDRAEIAAAATRVREARALHGSILAQQP